VLSKQGLDGRKSFRVVLHAIEARAPVDVQVDKGGSEHSVRQVEALSSVRNIPFLARGDFDDPSVINEDERTVQRFNGRM
jgi:hypothetical protein